VLLDILRSWFSSKDESQTEQDFPEEWTGYLKNNLPLYRKLPEELRQKLHRKTARLIRQVWFEGCGGLELTNEIILTIAAQACMLIMNREGSIYPGLKSILVYPSTFIATHKSAGPGGMIIEETVPSLGESWENGTVILAWDAVTNGATNIRDGHNVTFHEFAHQLDQVDGRSDGIPTLRMNREDLKTWCHFSKESFAELIDAAERGQRSLFDHYGATNPAEFFAVATETFFEKPRQFSKKEPELYRAFVSYFKLDPIYWE